MATSLYRATVLTVYQLSIVLGIAFLPVALVAKRVGISVPIDKLLARLDAAYERVASQ